MGYSEKSTRYQVFSGESFVTPPGAPEGMKEFAAQFYAAYDSLYPKVLARVSALTGKPIDDRTVKARAFDNVRYLLPAGTGTNLAMVGNLRDIRYLIQDGRGHENPEIREIAEDVIRAASEVCPVLVQRAEPNTFEPPIRSLGALSDLYNPDSPNWYVEQYAALGSPYVNQDYFKFVVRTMYHMSWEEFCAHMELRGKRAVPKVFRTIRMNFDILMDYGAFRDLQRHRRCEQYVEPLTTNYGYLVPDDIAGTDMEVEYRAAMELAKSYLPTLDPHLRQYVIPLGYLHRSVFDMDLAEVYYLTELRTQPQGHISYRRVAYGMYEVAYKEYPDLMQWCKALRPDSIGAHT
jgi:thymidylate synthase ThyX